MSRWLSLTLGACLLPALAAAQHIVTIKAPGEIEAHKLSGRHSLPIRQPHQDEWPWRGVTLQIIVDADGSVMSAKPLDGDKTYFEPAVETALQWRFSPFTRNGHVVKATFTDSVLIVPPERRPHDTLPMPEVRDWNSLRITLSRTACLGTCPQYDLVVRGNGTVDYTGDLYTKYCGEWHGTIPLSSVRELVGEFRATDFFALYPEYTQGATDLPTFTTSISFDNVHRKVVDYGGEEVGMPDSVHQLENAIDRLAGPEHWIARRKMHSGVDTSCDSQVPTAPETLPEGVSPKQ
jgi:hypothetical protein